MRAIFVVARIVLYKTGSTILSRTFSKKLFANLSLAMSSITQTRRGVARKTRLFMDRDARSRRRALPARAHNSVAFAPSGKLTMNLIIRSADDFSLAQASRNSCDGLYCAGYWIGNGGATWSGHCRNSFGIDNFGNRIRLGQAVVTKGSRDDRA